MQGVRLASGRIARGAHREVGSVMEGRNWRGALRPDGLLEPRMQAAAGRRREEEGGSRSAATLMSFVRLVSLSCLMLSTMSMASAVEGRLPCAWLQPRVKFWGSKLSHRHGSHVCSLAQDGSWKRFATPWRMIASDPSVKGLQAPTAQGESIPVRYYDTTLRDGAQGEGISLSCDDKLRIAARLHRFGVDYIEGGWPGSNPKDAEFFERAKVELPPAAWDKVAAFGSTRYKNVKVEDDKQVKMLVDSGARVVTLVGKSWDLHVDQVLETSREENLAMIFDTVSYLKSLGREVMLDAEHFYDGYSANPEYAMSCLSAAVDAGVDWLVLCDTNGGSLPWDIEDLTREVVNRFPGVKVGIHCHNDQGMAVANSLAAVRGGARVIQGTINGYGERTGNANAMSILPTLSLAMKECCSIGLENLRGITSLSRYVDEQANQPNNPRAGMIRRDVRN
eukprot:758078-Hanusia_phi.AAC.3